MHHFAEMMSQRYLKSTFLSMQNAGFFFECGANDGQFFSTTLDLEAKQNWTGLLVEAHPKLGTELLQKRRKAWFANVCASPNDSISEVGPSTVKCYVSSFCYYQGSKEQISFFCCACAYV